MVGFQHRHIPFWVIGLQFHQDFTLFYKHLVLPLCLGCLIPEEHAIPDSPEWFILKWESPGVHKTNRRDHGLFNAQTCKRIKAYAFFESLLGLLKWGSQAAMHMLMFYIYYYCDLTINYEKCLLMVNYCTILTRCSVTCHSWKKGLFKNSP